MGLYRTAEVCPNGHVSTYAADVNPELREKFCSKCGEATSTQCSECGASIRGDYHVEGVLNLGGSYEPPSFCHNCGSAFEWTNRKIGSAVELVQEGGGLSDQEIEQFRQSLTALTKDSPEVQVASIRYKKLMAKAGTAVAGGVKEIIVSVLSEAAKKAIWGG